MACDVERRGEVKVSEGLLLTGIGIEIVILLYF